MRSADAIRSKMWKSSIFSNVLNSKVGKKNIREARISMIHSIYRTYQKHDLNTYQLPKRFAITTFEK